jgi:hypothetical protein
MRTHLVKAFSGAECHGASEDETHGRPQSAFARLRGVTAKPEPRARPARVLSIPGRRRRRARRAAPQARRHDPQKALGSATTRLPQGSAERRAPRRQLGCDVTMLSFGVTSEPFHVMPVADLAGENRPVRGQATRWRTHEQLVSAAQRQVSRRSCTGHRQARGGPLTRPASSDHEGWAGCRLDARLGAS